MTRALARTRRLATTPRWRTRAGRARTLVMCAVACALWACADGGDGRVRLTITRATASGDDVVLDVLAERAVTADERRRGLMGHAPLAPGQALLIEIPIETEVCIVNGGVEFDIDAVYADAGGSIVAIERVIAAGDPTARCHAPAQWVVETGAGEADAVAVGDQLVLPDAVLEP